MKNEIQVVVEFQLLQKLCSFAYVCVFFNMMLPSTCRLLRLLRLLTLHFNIPVDVDDDDGIEFFCSTVSSSNSRYTLFLHCLLAAAASTSSSSSSFLLA